MEAPQSLTGWGLGKSILCLQPTRDSGAMPRPAIIAIFLAFDLLFRLVLTLFVDVEV